MAWSGGENEKMVLVTDEFEPRMNWRSRGNEVTSDSVGLKDWGNTRVAPVHFITHKAYIQQTHLTQQS